MSNKQRNKPIPISPLLVTQNAELIENMVVSIKENVDNDRRGSLLDYGYMQEYKIFEIDETGRIIGCKFLVCTNPVGNIVAVASDLVLPVDNRRDIFVYKIIDEICEDSELNDIFELSQTELKGIVILEKKSITELIKDQNTFKMRKITYIIKNEEYENQEYLYLCIVRHEEILHDNSLIIRYVDETVRRIINYKNKDELRKSLIIKQHLENLSYVHEEFDELKETAVRIVGGVVSGVETKFNKISSKAESDSDSKNRFYIFVMNLQARQKKLMDLFIRFDEFAEVSKVLEESIRKLSDCNTKLKECIELGEFDVLGIK